MAAVTLACRGASQGRGEGTLHGRSQSEAHEASRSPDSLYHATTPGTRKLRKGEWSAEQHGGRDDGNN